MADQPRLCPCCKLGRVGRSPVCPACELHQGSTGIKLQRRDADHVAAWKAERDTRKRRADQTIALLEEKVAAAQHELEQRPVNVVHENLDKEVVEEAESNRDAAYRSRDAAMAALCKVRLLHHESDPGQCSCGSRYARCRTAQAVDECRSLESWESKQITRLRRNLPHYLPDNHPAVLDPRIARR